MKRGLLFGIVTTLMLTLSGPLEACGDKFSVRAASRFSKVYAAIYPGRLVMYAPVKGELAGMDGLDKALKRAGHQVVIARDLATLSRALQDRAIDIVLADNAHLTEAGAAAGEIAVKPTVLPVTRSAVNFLRTLDDTMKSRLSLRPFSAAASK